MFRINNGVGISDVVKKDPTVNDGTGLDGVCQVVIFNDNVNSFDHVIKSLVSVFGHSLSLAEKVTMEAHKTGRAIAEVEEYEKAVVHKGMLNARSLKAEVEKI